MLEESDVTLSSLGYPADLDNFNTIVTIVKRPPYYLQTRWLRITAEIEKQGIDPKFKDLVKFVQNEAEIVYSSHASAVNQRMKRKTGSSFFAKTDKQISEIGQTQRALATKKCMYCKEDHKIEDCKKIVDLTLPYRISFTRRNRLCGNCF